MFDNIVTVCLLGVFVLVGFALIPRLFGGMFGGGNKGGLSGRGDASPRYDDPDVTSRGGFGGLGRRRGGGTNVLPRSGGRAQGGNTPRNDDPDIESRGGFGKSKD